MLKEVHPDVTELVWKFGREHHHVNYLPFKDTRLKRKNDVVLPEGNDDYGMKIKKLPAEYPGRV